MSLLYLDCFSGVSGDMLIASLIDLGVDREELVSFIDQLGLKAAFNFETAHISGLAAVRFSVEPASGQPMRHLHDIYQILDRLSEEAVKEQAKRVFHLLATAEAHVHGVDISSVHFHEIGAVDTIIDVVGTLFALKKLDVERVSASPLPWSRGLVNIAHGNLPLPAPAAAELLTDIPCYGVEAGIELVTPTGVALLKTVVSQFGEFPGGTPCKVGYGAGHMQRSDGVPNLLRSVLVQDSSAAFTDEYIAVLECEIDDMNPEVFSSLMEAFTTEASVLDFYMSPVYMKKNRPGTRLAWLCRPHNVTEVARKIFLSTTTLGVRVNYQQRFVLPREQHFLESPWGKVAYKTAVLPDGSLRHKLEYEDCASISRQTGLPLLSVYQQLNALLE